MNAIMYSNGNTRIKKNIQNAEIKQVKELRHKQQQTHPEYITIFCSTTYKQKLNTEKHHIHRLII